MYVSLEKTFRYLKIQKSWRSENFTDYFCIREYFDVFFSTTKYIPQAKNKINHRMNYNRIIICLKGISEKKVFRSMGMSKSLMAA